MTNHLNILLNQLESKAASFETINPSISTAAVGWHIEHILLTIDGITLAVSKANATDYKWTFNFIRTVVMTTKKIPRGKAKAPQVVKPTGDINKESLTYHLIKTREKIAQLNTFPKGNFFEHPFFGKLKLNQTVRFLEIHTNHHLAIINDILKNAI